MIYLWNRFLSLEMYIYIQVLISNNTVKEFSDRIHSFFMRMLSWEAQRINLCQLMYGSIFAKNSDIKRYQRFRWVNKDIGDHKCKLSSPEASQHQQQSTTRRTSISKLRFSLGKLKKAAGKSCILRNYHCYRLWLDNSWRVLVCTRVLSYDIFFKKLLSQVPWLIISYLLNFCQSLLLLTWTMWNYVELQFSATSEAERKALLGKMLTFADLRLISREGIVALTVIEVEPAISVKV